MRTFLEHTISELRKNGKRPEDVQWIGYNTEKWNNDITPHWFTWGEFIQIAHFPYEESQTAYDIHNNLVIVGDGWYMDRGSSLDDVWWWNYHSFPQKPGIHHVSESLKK